MIVCLKKHCPHCNSVYVKKNGHYSDEKQRWYCNVCKKSFSWKNPKIKKQREKVWFEKWIVEGYSVRQISEQSGHSQAKLYRIINYWLNQSPSQIEQNLSKYSHLILDGTFLHRPVSIITLMDAKTNSVVCGEYDVRENSEKQLLAFLAPLKDKCLDPLSFTVDGNPHAIKVIKKVWPNIIIQRCLVHVQRQGLMWCRANPKTPYAKKLREIFLKVTYIRNEYECNQFLGQLNQWEKKYGQYIAIQPERGRVFSDIKRARSMLLKALPNMFHYLDNPNIPFSTNGLEGYFSRLKGHYRQHRGLQKEKLKNYFSWYFFLRPK